MEIPDIPDNRPKNGGPRSRSALSHTTATPMSPTPTIQLDDDHDRFETDSMTSSLHYSLDDQPPLRSQSSIRSLRRNGMINGHGHTNGSTNELPILQELNPLEETDELEPVNENEEGLSYDLVVPYDGDSVPLHSLERQADTMFSSEHMLTILTNPRYLAHFREFLSEERPKSLPVLTYYLNACKALKAIQYANALVRLSIDVPTAGIQRSQSKSHAVGRTENVALETRVHEALMALTAEELPAFITSTCINVTSKVVAERVRGTLPDKFGGTADALAEVFCLTDPSRPDNPIIFASGEFHRTTQYGMDYVLGRNCRFLQGPKTNPNSTRRIREGIEEGRHHSELFLNYRRDGSPFMNLLQCAPLCDSYGKIRYFIGAQIDVSGLAMEGARMESLQDLQMRKDPEWNSGRTSTMSQYPEAKSEFQELGELFSPRELRNLHEHGGNLFQPVVDSTGGRTWLIPEGASNGHGAEDDSLRAAKAIKSPLEHNISLTGVYRHYLLIRPYPSLRVLFTSPSLRIPGILQTSFFSRIGASPERDSLYEAMMVGRSVTARIRWLTKYDVQGRNRWLHCTPLLSNNGQVGVWMVVIINDDEGDV